MSDGLDFERREFICEEDNCDKGRRLVGSWGLSGRIEEKVVGVDLKWWSFGRGILFEESNCVINANEWMCNPNGVLFVG